MTRSIKTFAHNPVEHILESQTIDFDNRSFSFTAFGHEDPNLITIQLGEYESTLSRDTMREGFARILDAVEAVPSIPRSTF